MDSSCASMSATACSSASRCARALKSCAPLAPAPWGGSPPPCRSPPRPSRAVDPGPGSCLGLSYARGLRHTPTDRRAAPRAQNRHGNEPVPSAAFLTVRAAPVAAPRCVVAPCLAPRVGPRCAFGVGHPPNRRLSRGSGRRERARPTAPSRCRERCSEGACILNDLRCRSSAQRAALFAHIAPACLRRSCAQMEVLAWRDPGGQRRASIAAASAACAVWTLALFDPGRVRVSCALGVVRSARRSPCRVSYYY